MDVLHYQADKTLEIMQSGSLTRSRWGRRQGAGTGTRHGSHSGTRHGTRSWARHEWNVTMRGRGRGWGSPRVRT